MITDVVARLKTGKLKRVVPYGTIPLPQPPYTVVKIEAGFGGQIYRIIAHFLPGQNIFLDDYIDTEVRQLLGNYICLGRHGNRNILKTENEYVGIIANNDDGTISRERRFLAPSIPIN